MTVLCLHSYYRYLVRLPSNTGRCGKGNDLSRTHNIYGSFIFQVPFLTPIKAFKHIQIMLININELFLYSQKECTFARIEQKTILNY